LHATLARFPLHVRKMRTSNGYFDYPADLVIATKGSLERSDPNRWVEKMQELGEAASSH